MGSSPDLDSRITQLRQQARRKRALSFERRILLLSALAVAPPLLASLLLIIFRDWAASTKFAVFFLLLLSWAVLYAILHDSIVRPMQTLANVVAALREEDYSFRARGARPEDALGELALEVNALADLLTSHKTRTVEATALLGRVVEEVDVPLFAFDPAGILRLVNSAGATLLRRSPASLLGQSADALGLAPCLSGQPEETLSFEGQNSNARWLMRRSQFRQNGVPHTLVVLSDVSRALREEERSAWQRLIRVLGHELNNSLTPIKSIAGSLAARIGAAPSDWDGRDDFARGLAIIEARSASLNRFLQAYRQLAQMPRPALRRVELRPLLERVAALELRLPIEIQPGLAVDLLIDPDQVEQMLINLLRNAVDAALEANRDSEARVTVAWTSARNQVEVSISDNGPGLLNPENVFVPFYTTKSGGSGIGLALSRQIAEAHRGRLNLAQREDQPGCVAIIVLPRTP
jgi:nitrogen fixation/metabolism regulation signal transduction histidine kinase